MICNEIKYKGEKILTIFHKLDDCDKCKNFEIKSNEIDDLIFIQKNVDDVTDEKIMEEYSYVIKETGFLEEHTNENPYYNGCANMTHYKCGKSQSIFKLSEDKYILNNISINELNKINNFIKKYTGIRIKKDFTIYGDVFVFESIRRSFLFDDDYIKFNDSYFGSDVIMIFKKGNTIIDNKIEHISNENKEIFIGSKWNSMDLIIFKNGKLVYCKTGFSLMRNLSIRTIILGETNSFVFENKKIISLIG